MSGWLAGVEHCPSPNFNQRPQGEVSLLVVHNISLPPGQFGTGQVQRFFCNQLGADEHPYFEEIAHMQVSAHFLIERTGRVTQFVDCDQRAWHAGVSCYQGRESCNDFSVGVELEGTDDCAFTEEQYQALVVLTKQLLQRYPQLSVERICGHSDIAPGRKTDPGPYFDWSYFRCMLAEAEEVK